MSIIVVQISALKDFIEKSILRKIQPLQNWGMFDLTSRESRIIRRSVSDFDRDSRVGLVEKNPFFNLPSTTPVTSP
jgi:hypothetical protein